MCVCIFFSPGVRHSLAPLITSVQAGSVGGFLPAVKQLANVACLPGIVGRSIALPDVHSGYGFAIGNVAAFDFNDPNAVVRLSSFLKTVFVPYFFCAFILFIYLFIFWLLNVRSVLVALGSI